MEQQCAVSPNVSFDEDIFFDFESTEEPEEKKKVADPDKLGFGHEEENDDIEPGGDEDDDLGMFEDFDLDGDFEEEDE